MESRKESGKGRGSKALLLCGAVLAVICCGAFSACDSRGEEQQGQIRGELAVPEEQGQAAREPAAPEQGETVQEEQPPKVLDPDEEGRFPPISDADFEKWVTKGPPEPKPETVETVPFMENPKCTQWLAENYLEIDDWQVLFEESTLQLFPMMYDPYHYQWRDQWKPFCLTVLGTGQSADFDRLVLIQFEEVAVVVGPGDILSPEQRTSIYPCFGWASQIDGEGYGDAQALYMNKDGYAWSYPSLYFTQQNRLLLLDFNMQNILPVVGVDSMEEPMVIFHNSPLTDYFPQTQAGEDRIVYLYSSDNVDKGSRICYYHSQSQQLVPFEGGEGSDFRLYPLEEPVLALQNEGCLYLYDVASDTPTSPFRVLGGQKAGGALDSEQQEWVIYYVITERQRPQNHAILYYKQEERELRVCTFTTRGEVLSDFSTSLEAEEGYLGSMTYSDGLVYFTYYPDGTGYNGEHYCVDVRPGYDHTPQKID